MRNRAAIEFSLHWKSRYAVHNDRCYIDKIDFWRDIFPGSMGDKLEKLDARHIHSETFRPGELVPNYNDKNLLVIRNPPHTPATGITKVTLEPGRYYPKGYFWKPLSSFPTDQTPVRLVEADDSSLVIDTNHPLAGYPLQVEALVKHTSTIAAQRGGSLNDIAQIITARGPGMQAPVDEIRYSFGGATPLKREDESNDRLYYRSPRLVHHLDATARNLVSSFYGQILENGTRIFDLMSSWESHIPESLESCHVEGLGLNQQELEANGRLSSFMVHDLNEQPVIPVAESSFDAAVCTVSIEYLCRPLEVLSELARILVPGGILALTISERWFPGKQVARWEDLHPFERQGIVLSYLLDQGAFTDIHTESVRGYPRPADDRYADKMSNSDSLYFIWARCTK
ncbi:MAG: methyltransferase domain-containing protein [Desulfofustis sp.]|nr:methyltransferase domain-containing protein [Desulfofustis sp.]